MNGSTQPAEIVVSDDSVDEEMQQATGRVVAEFPSAKYVRGPQRGVCANRNCALGHLGNVEYVGYVDDDGLVNPDYLSMAVKTYGSLPEQLRKRTILTGTRISDVQTETLSELDFRCYFRRATAPKVAGASYAVYPKAFFDQHPWDEKIFFGYEDAELSLRALKDGYHIVHVQDMVVIDSAHGQSTVIDGSGQVSGYDFLGEAARLYVGVKRYKDIERNYAKLAVFVPLFFAQIVYSLGKRRSLGTLPKLLRQSRVVELFSKG